jgi:hypothetical protein
VFPGTGQLALNCSEPDGGSSTLIPIDIGTERRGMKKMIVATLLPLLGFSTLAARLELFSIQPLGAVPKGLTLLVWRHAGEPFFYSLDGSCERSEGAVSVAAPIERIVARLPYLDWAYRASVTRKTYRDRAVQPDSGQCGGPG